MINDNEFEQLLANIQQMTPEEFEEWCTQD